MTLDASERGRVRFARLGHKTIMIWTERCLSPLNLLSHLSKKPSSILVAQQNFSSLLVESTKSSSASRKVLKSCREGAVQVSTGTLPYFRQKVGSTKSVRKSSYICTIACL